MQFEKRRKFCLKSHFFKVFFIFSFVGGRNPKKYILYLDNIFFSLKLHKLPIFMLLSLFYDNIFFSKTAYMTLFSMFFGDLQLLKQNHFFYEKNILHQKSLFSNFLLISMFLLKTRK